MNPRVSVIISVYKNVEALHAVLDSLKKQTSKELEIVISEDGDSHEMADFVKEYHFENPFQHVTHEDIGWRKNLALNRAIIASKGSYLIFVDGDCVLEPHFVEWHVRLSERNSIVAGKRVKLNPELSDKLLRNPDFDIQKALRSKLFSAKKEGIKFYEEGFYFAPNSFFGFIPRLRSMTWLKGCNMSFYKEAIYKINGFDLDYVRPAIGEDIDITWRFEKMGYKLVSARNLAVQYHLYHKENWTDQEENVAIMKSKQAANQYVCKRGLMEIQYPDAGTK